MCKRLLDLLLSLLGLALVWPLMLFISLVIYLDSPGPVFFSQERLGRYGKRFLMHKFRKFPSDWGTKGAGVTTNGDVRMTRVGRILERTKLDELPQLWNILLGQMSFVGPRPESTRYADLFKDDYKRVLDFPPGIFGPNQVAFRNESTLYPGAGCPEEFYRTELFSQKAENDLKYFKQATCWGDIKWIVHGLWASVAGVVSWRRIFGLHAPIVLTDLIAIQLALVCAYNLRFGFHVPAEHTEYYFTGIWLMPLIVLPLMVLGGVYRHPVRHFSIGDVFRLGTVVMIAWMFASIIEMGFYYRQMSIAIGLLGIILVLPLMIAPRIWTREKWHRQNAAQPDDRCVHILIYGAGHRGAGLATFFKVGYPKVKIVGFVDDDELLRGRYVHGHEVMGSERDLAMLAEIKTVHQLWTTFYPDSAKHQRINTWAVENQIEIVVMPALSPFDVLDENQCV